jgi:hypothetical protein
MSIDILLIIHAAGRRYAVRRADVAEIKFVADASAMPSDAQGRPYLGVELGPLLDIGDHSVGICRRGLIVSLRRRSVALLVERIETFQEHASTVRLPELLAARLEQPWAVGALVLDGEVVVQLDLRAIARSALARPSTSAAAPSSASEPG